FPTGDYEILIELYDTYTDEVVAILDSYSDPDLYLLTLESKDYEYIEPVIIIDEHGGSMGFFSLLLLPMLAWRRRWLS
uniref:GlyGly-CTERM sorting domain-containing protein n=1 Tax=Paraglaciecola sp. TaxID=1920173 RepID=UPI0030F37114